MEEEGAGRELTPMNTSQEAEPQRAQRDTENAQLAADARRRTQMEEEGVGRMQTRAQARVPVPHDHGRGMKLGKVVAAGLALQILMAAEVRSNQQSAIRSNQQSAISTQPLDIVETPDKNHHHGDNHPSKPTSGLPGAPGDREVKTRFNTEDAEEKQEQVGRELTRTNANQGRWPELKGKTRFDAEDAETKEAGELNSHYGDNHRSKPTSGLPGAPDTQTRRKPERDEPQRARESGDRVIGKAKALEQGGCEFTPIQGIPHGTPGRAGQVNTNEEMDRRPIGVPVVSQGRLRQAEEGHMQGEAVYGAPLGLAAMAHAPTNEAGVIFLFGVLAAGLGFRVERLQTVFPDCEAKREVRPGMWERVRIEFEFESRSFKDHRHDPARCHVIVCWKHNWPECPEGLEVVELRGIMSHREIG